tara:strand:+ start:735 stop:1043 length:309 start_codon:yes stop_codon:yes gene_type:complete
MANFALRLSQLEQKHIKPPPIHIIMKSYGGQSHDEAFDMYQAERTAEGYTPQGGWEQLKTEFLSDEGGVDKMMFITFDVRDSASLRPPIVTNAKKFYELKII